MWEWALGPLFWVKIARRLSSLGTKIVVGGLNDFKGAFSGEEAHKKISAIECKNLLIVLFDYNE